MMKMAYAGKIKENTHGYALDSWNYSGLDCVESLDTATDGDSDLNVWCL